MLLMFYDIDITPLLSVVTQSINELGRMKEFLLKTDHNNSLHMLGQQRNILPEMYNSCWPVTIMKKKKKGFMVCLSSLFHFSRLLTLQKRYNKIYKV